MGIGASQIDSRSAAKSSRWSKRMRCTFGARTLMNAE